MLSQLIKFGSLNQVKDVEALKKLIQGTRVNNIKISQNLLNDAAEDQEISYPFEEPIF